MLIAENGTRKRTLETAQGDQDVGEQALSSLGAVPRAKEVLL
jgi:hypothetical protein